MCVGTCPASGAPVCDFSSSAEPSVGATSRPAARAVVPPSRSPKNPAAGKPECLSHTPHAFPLTHVLASCLQWERDVGLAGGARGASPRGGDAANTAGCDRCSEVWGIHPECPRKCSALPGMQTGRVRGSGEQRRGVEAARQRPRPGSRAGRGGVGGRAHETERQEGVAGGQGGGHVAGA